MRLKVFLNSIFPEYNDDIVRDQSNSFYKIARSDPDPVEELIKKFVNIQKERVKRGKNEECMVCNYYKPTKLFYDIFIFITPRPRI